MKTDLTDRVAVVTGSSRGLGRAIAFELARRGAHVVINYRRNDAEGRSTLDQIEAAGGMGSLWQADVTDADQVQRMFMGLFKKFRRLDILINNAGITRDGYLLMLKSEDWNEVVDVNLTGVFHCSKAAVRYMAGQRRGVIINIGSGAGLVAMPGQVNYSSAKAGLLGFSRSLAREVAPKGIRVMHVAPGFFKSDMSESLMKEFIEETYRLTPLGRWGLPEELATLVRFLCSDDASFYSGQTITIDGGRGAVESEFGL